jgi:hypothetical protein
MCILYLIISILKGSYFNTKAATYIICTYVYVYKYGSAYQTTGLVPLLTKARWIFMSALAIRILIAKGVRFGAESLEGSQRMHGGRGKLAVNLRSSPFKKDLLSARSISLVSAFSSIFKYFGNPALYFGKVLTALYTVQVPTSTISVMSFGEFSFKPRETTKTTKSAATSFACARTVFFRIISRQVTKYVMTKLCETYSRTSQNKHKNFLSCPQIWMIENIHVNREPTYL